MDHLRYHLTVRLYRQDKSFGPGPMRLLRGVEEGGSLHQAAEAMGMSYSKAWTLLRKLEKEWGFTLLDRQPGGPKGGGRGLCGLAAWRGRPGNAPSGCIGPAGAL